MSQKGFNLYRSAIAEAFPDLTLKSLKYLAEGWDSVTFLVNRTLVFRFPKRKEIETALRKEQLLLPLLEPALPLPVPRFSYTANRPGNFYPFIFAGYELIPGTQLEECTPEVRNAEWWKPQLGAFLSALHAFPVPRLNQVGISLVPVSLVPGTAKDWREAFLHFYLSLKEHVFKVLPPEPIFYISGAFEDFLGNKDLFQFSPCLLHADFTPEHIILNLKLKQVAGIIDFGDACLGDPAYDVPDYLLPFYQGQVDPGWQQRRAFYQKLAPLQALHFGILNRDLALQEYGKYEIARLWGSYGKI